MRANTELMKIANVLFPPFSEEWRELQVEWNNPKYDKIGWYEFLIVKGMYDFELFQIILTPQKEHLKDYQKELYKFCEEEFNKRKINLVPVMDCKK